MKNRTFRKKHLLCYSLTVMSKEINMHKDNKRHSFLEIPPKLLVDA